MGNAYFGGLYVDTLGQSVLSVAVCDRCSRKMAYTMLRPDPNSPGLMVCPDDYDQYDPWRLAARQTETITLRHPRPDVSVDIQGKGKPIQNAPNVANLNEGPDMIGTGSDAFTPALYGNETPVSTDGDIKKT